MNNIFYSFCFSSSVPALSFLICVCVCVCAAWVSVCCMSVCVCVWGQVMQMAWSCSTDGFLNLTAFYYANHPFMRHTLCVWVWPRFCVHFELIATIQQNINPIWNGGTKARSLKFIVGLRSTTPRLYAWSYPDFTFVTSLLLLPGFLSHTQMISLLFNLLIISVSLLSLSLQRWEVLVRRRHRVIGGVWAPSCLNSWQAWWVKKYKNCFVLFFLSLLRRCCGMSVGVLAFNSLTLFMVVPGCVWFCARVCMCLSRWRLLFWCVRVCVRCVLAAVSYSGSQGVPGVSVWLSPPAWAPSAGPWGQLSPGLFAGS